jgi:hypothetical protein
MIMITTKYGVFLHKCRLSPGGISWNSIHSPGDNSDWNDTAYGAISIKGSGSPTNLNPISSYSNAWSRTSYKVLTADANAT